MSTPDKEQTIPERVQQIIDHFQFDKIPIEGTLYKSTYVSQKQLESGPIGTAIVGFYSETPKSVSTFHRLTQDEIWHFYDGDPLVLHLLHDNGTYQKVVMGRDILQGHLVQFVVPANVWQAGEVMFGGVYSLYGCTLAPGFTGDCFEGGMAKELIKSYPGQAELINRLSPHGEDTKMPKGYTQ